MYAAIPENPVVVPLVTTSTETKGCANVDTRPPAGPCVDERFGVGHGGVAGLVRPGGRYVGRMQPVAWTEVGLVASGGALGCVARYLASLAAVPMSAAFPWATFAINVVGSFVLGAVLGALPAGHAGRLFFGTGLCGGFTTFSTFSAEVVALVERGAVGRAGAYAAGSIVVGVAAAMVGAMMGRAVVAR